jgi:Actin
MPNTVHSRRPPIDWPSSCRAFAPLSPPQLAGVIPAATAAAASHQSSKHYGRSGTQYSFDLQPPRQNISLKNPLPEGLVSDWDAVTAMLDYALVERCSMPTRVSVAAAAAATAASSSKGGAGAGASKSSSTTLSSAAGQPARNVDSNRIEASLKNNPFILSEHIYASKADREKWCELLFEKYDAPGVFISKGGIFSLYANARTTGVTVDLGAGGTTITPVQDGYPLMMGVRIHPLGGNVLTEELGKALQERFSKGSSSSSSSSSSAAGNIFKGLWSLPASPPSVTADGSASSSSAGASALQQSWHPSVLQYNLFEQMKQMKVSDILLE